MKIKVIDLKFGVNRPQSWWDEKPQAVEMQKRLKWDIEQYGLKDPFIVEERQDGYYVIKGNQRLKCIIDNSLADEVDCLFAHQATKEQKESSDFWDPDKVFAHLIPKPVQIQDEPDSTEVLSDGYSDGYQI